MDAEVVGYLTECCKIRNGEGPTQIQVKVWEDILEDKSSEEIIFAIRQAMKTTYGRLTPDKVFSCFKSRHPNPEQAWNMIPKSEWDAGYISQQMSEAMGACQDSIDRGDLIGARMAFIETYKELIRDDPEPRFFLSRSSHPDFNIKNQKNNEALENARAKKIISEKEYIKICYNKEPSINNVLSLTDKTMEEYEEEVLNIKNDKIIFDKVDLKDKLEKLRNSLNENTREVYPYARRMPSLDSGNWRGAGESRGNQSV